MKKKHFLVTGASGFVGTHMVKALLERGYRVTACDLRHSDGGKFDPLSVRFAPVDITRKYTLDGIMEDVDTVMHVAAIFDHSAPWEVLKRVNAKGTRNVCEAAAEQGVKKLVYFSSCEIYGKPDRLPADERCKVQPTHDYGESKFLGEREAFKVSVSSNLNVVVLRPAAPYGPGSTYGAISLLYLLYRNHLPAIPGEGRNRIHMVHVKDVVNAAIFLAEHPDTAGREYNLSDDTPIPIEDMISCSAAILGVRPPTLHLPKLAFKAIIPLFEIPALVEGRRPVINHVIIDMFFNDMAYDSSKIRALGYKLLYPDVCVGLREVMEWYKKEKLLTSYATALS